MKKVNSILYVEDEQNVQEELSEFLEDFCEKLYLAKNGQEGLELYNIHKPDIIITDINMPVMNGISMSKKIKELNEDAYIIFTSAYTDIDFFQDAIELQIELYILKPINLDVLENKITKISKDIYFKQELELNKKIIIQQSKLASMGSMLSVIAHQWRQPLNALNGALINIIDAKNYNQLSDNYLQKQLESAEKYIQYMSKTIDDFGNYFKPNYSKSNFIINEIIQNTIFMLSKNLKEHNISIYFSDDIDINFYGYKNLLQQVILNILNNSIDAFSQTFHKNEAIIKIELTENIDEVILSIQDNAGGIEEKIFDKIFEPYFTTKINKNGTGIGLYICKNIIEYSFKSTLDIKNNDDGLLTTIILKREKDEI